MGGGGAGQYCPACMSKSIGFSLFEVHDRFRKNTYDGNKALDRT
jgi:hypothetical protein